MATTGQTQSPLCFNLTATIAVGQTQSEAIDLNGTTLLGIITPSNLTGTGFTFLACDTLTGTYIAYYDLAAGAAFASGTVTTSKYYGTSSVNFAPVRFIKIVSNATQLTSDAVLKLVSRSVS